MSDKVVLIENGDAVYAVPTDVCEKYALDGEVLEGARKALSVSDNDVEGQSEGYNNETRTSSDGRTWEFTRDYSKGGTFVGEGTWSRTPWSD